jgi:GT2 family glycosyltransferase
MRFQELSRMHCPITAIVTAHRRIPETLATLARLQDCDPAPMEILVHVDSGGDECRQAIERSFPNLQIVTSDLPVGPGGARNKLLAKASNEIVASFDDDSHPIDLDYFSRLQQIFAACPEAAVVTADVFIRGQRVASSSSGRSWVADFIGCACAYRKSVFLQVQGYVPLPVAYGMEEVDVALQLYALGHRVLKTSDLRVFHDMDFSGHVSSKLVSGTIANAALLAYLRYPPSYWPHGILQVLNACWYALRKRRYRGILKGLFMIPSHLYRHKQYRDIVNSTVLCGYLKLRRNPMVRG